MKLMVLAAVSALAMSAQDANLASLVAKGEGWGTSAITSSEIMRCWATWSFIREQVAANGRTSFPADYSVANLDRRVADWDRAVTAAYAEDPPYYRTNDAKKAAEKVRADGLATNAEWSGMCKTLPKGIASSVANAVTVAPAPATAAAVSDGAETPASWGARGRTYSRGEGVARNPQQALYWTRKAAEAGDARAQYDLSTYYYQGINGVPEDTGEFMRWTQAAAKGGSPSAQYNLGLSYYQGSNGLPKNLPESAKWFRLSAENGDPDGQTDYGTSLWWGHGVAVNYPEAVRWFRKAADQGHADGQFWLGNAYRRGLGVEFDIAQARYWLNKAKAQGHENAPGMLAFMDQIDREFAQRAPAVQRETRDGNSLWKQYAETMERQRRENCAAAAQGRNRVCDKW